jgi:hypothetical protein
VVDNSDQTPEETVADILAKIEAVKANRQ